LGKCMNGWTYGWMDEKLGTNSSSRKSKRMWIDWMKRRNEFSCLMEYYFATCFITFKELHNYWNKKYLGKKVVFRKRWKYGNFHFYLFYFLLPFSHTMKWWVFQTHVLLLLLLLLLYP
jgi:hypothetical protein